MMKESRYYMELEYTFNTESQWIEITISGNEVIFSNISVCTTISEEYHYTVT
jgi:hypothetical protein